MSITRLIQNNKLKYFNSDGSILKNEDNINRITKMAIPPKWKDVKITNSPTDYLQVTGVDSKGRTQYIYHPLWTELSKHEKYSRLENFIKNLPLLRNYVNKILNGPINFENREYIISIVIKILDNTFSRIGNDIHKEENNTYGLTTILKKHIKISDSSIIIKYVGKKNVIQSHEYKDVKCANILKNLLELPGERVFKTSNMENINSIDINNFLKDVMKGNYTSKDFRTYATNKLLLKYLYSYNPPQNEKEAKKILIECCNNVAEKLGHTRQVSKTNYIYPLILEEYTKNPDKFIRNKADILSLF
jgi:DNA topoisomerase-1